MKLQKLPRPTLNPVGLQKAVEAMLGCEPGFHITMSIGQWDNYLDMMYFKLGATIIELDCMEHPIAAYKLLETKDAK